MVLYEPRAEAGYSSVSAASVPVLVEKLLATGLPYSLYASLGFSGASKR